ncbi:MAG: hypothetical protein QOI04_1114 [Verrucomicrobiota bacterium]
MASVTTGGNNTANGYRSLFVLTTGGYNTATGSQALLNATTGNSNTATGGLAMQANTSGASNTGNGFQALYWNTVGNENTADGSGALFNNTTGGQNTAVGTNALFSNTTAFQNTAVGVQALYSNTTGLYNTALGFQSLHLGTTAAGNVAVGYSAGANLTTGSSNVLVGFSSGTNLAAGSNNIDIQNSGVSDESGAIRIGTAGQQTSAFIAGISGTTVAAGTSVVIDSNGQLGTIVSSQRFKDEIKPMDKASEAILSLKPVTFRYKHELDAKGIPQFGLVAEEVEKINPDLVARDASGNVYTVRYEAVNAMLLNEFLKEHRKVEELEAALARQQKGMELLASRVRAQGAQLEKVSAQVEANKPAPRVVDNDRQ